MTTGLIGGLLVAVAYLAKLWRDSKAENANLKAQIASLKRQLGRNGRGR